MAKNPLFSALSNVSAIEVQPVKLPEPRIMKFKLDELGNVRPGDGVKLDVYGVVSAIDREGNVQVNVTKAERCEEEDESSEDEQNMGKMESTIVRTQESHVPS